MSELYLNALLSIPRVFWWKIKALGKLKMPWIQSFGRNTRLYLNNGKILFGKEIVTRGNNTFRVEGGMLEIGDKCFFNENVSITCKGNIRIGDKCQIGNNVVIVDHDHADNQNWGKYKTEPVIIGNNVWVGANVVVLRGAKIGDNSVIAAGCVVHGDVPENSKMIQRRETIIREK